LRRFSCNDICKLFNGKCHVRKASRFAPVSRRSKAGRFAYNLRGRKKGVSQQIVSLSHLLVSLIRFESALALRPRKLELICGASSVKLSVER
jgi:hypothetical protein